MFDGDRPLVPLPVPARVSISLTKLGISMIVTLVVGRYFACSSARRLGLTAATIHITSKTSAALLLSSTACNFCALRRHSFRRLPRSRRVRNSATRDQTDAISPVESNCFTNFNCYQKGGPAPIHIGIAKGGRYRQRWALRLRQHTGKAYIRERTSRLGTP